MGHIPQFLKSMKNSSVFFIFNSRKYKAQCYSKIILTYIIVNIILHIILKYGVGPGMRSMFPVLKTDWKYPIFFCLNLYFFGIRLSSIYDIFIMTSIRHFFFNLTYICFILFIIKFLFITLNFEA